MWRIRKRENAREIEFFKIEETGHGRILTDEFINHRIKLNMQPSAAGKDAEALSESDEDEGGGVSLEGHLRADIEGAPSA